MIQNLDIVEEVSVYNIPTSLKMSLGLFYVEIGKSQHYHSKKKTSSKIGIGIMSALTHISSRLALCSETRGMVSDLGTSY